MAIQKFIHPLPKTILDDNDKRPFFEYLVQWLQANAVGTLSVSSGLTDTQVDQLFPNVDEQLLDEILVTQEEIETVQLRTRTISGETYTAQDNMFINATNDSVLLLPQYPIDNSVVYFTKDSTRFRLRGNGNNINGTNQEIVFFQDRLARQIHYFSDVGEWFFV